MFRQRNDAKKWFRHLNLKPAFDIYYFCLMAGLTEGAKKPLPSSNATDLVPYFPEVYEAQSRLIITLFLRRELEELSVNLENRKQLNATIASLVDPRSRAYLSQKGFREMNKYAFGGFEVLRDRWFEGEPRTIEVFLPRFYKKAKAHLS